MWSPREHTTANLVELMITLSVLDLEFFVVVTGAMAVNVLILLSISVFSEAMMRKAVVPMEWPM